jgi:broad specificity phosphatase PhoE/ubiquinone/menaquinone biosynthesis C-methylase UbiE
MAIRQASPTHLVLVRHAQSLHVQDGGRVTSDIGLTELGWRQAQAVAEWLARNYHVDTVLSSPLMRARQTAEIISGRLDIVLSLHEGLQEAETAYWDELPYRLTHPFEGWDSAWQPDPAITPRYAAFAARLRESLARLLAAYEGQTVVAVSHGGAISTILRGLFGGHRIAIYTENTGVTELLWDQDHWQLVCHNSTAHLRARAPEAPVTGSRPQYVPATLGNGEQLNGSVSAVMVQFEKVGRAGPSAAMPPSERDLRDMVRLARPGPEDRVLDAGSGFGAVSLAFAPRVRSVLGIDLSPAMLEHAETARAARDAANVRFQLGDVLSIPLDERSFDLIICHDLLQHTPDQQALFARARKLLASGGRLLVDQLIGNDDPVKRATQNAIELQRDPSLTGVPSAAEVERALTAAGFRVEALERYTITRELDEWLAQAAADDVTRSTVRSMIEAGLEADSAGMNARRIRDGQIQLTQARVRLLALPAGMVT